MKYFLSALYILTALLFMLFPDASRSAVSLSLVSVKNVVLCSLFPMTVLTRLISGSEAVRLLSRSLAKSRIWRALGLSDLLLPTVITGMLSGLPSAAREVGELAEEGRISSAESRKAVALASLPSPAFVIATSDGFGIGVLCFLLLAITAYVTVLFFPSVPSKGSTEDKSVTLSRAVSSAVTSMINVSGNIIFFTAVICLVSKILPRATSVAAAFLEMGSGVTLTRGVMRGVALGWCGLSAFSQIKAEAKGVDMKPYLTVRVISAFIMIICQIFMHFFR